ncbi:trypsin-like peptidase domain-containing protein [Natronospira bacteriovora]|uniref:Pro-apoptotic serine protease NMA111 n=1 Tax=Natronospira bacteriovora TaxID=3069753 RepID=A0ABU0W981_9GAMM|nr:trypsin-like peptidase domain-containing protein [Natronospira sp. AB-CW4]MDQ2070454.1 PDZ domain-containing protein [Natronospira sp. AB-CW4]
MQADIRSSSSVFLVLALVTGLLPATAAADWAQTLERISSGVVQIRVDAPRPFDTEWENSTEATGFVVDAERGIILTNRHVVYPGPVVAEAVFQNSEEVDLVPLYRDPVHDFGFFQYDPGKLRHIEPVSIPLVPDAARVGEEIRVVGNDAGERLSILSGTLARLDREAPNYGRGRYNDFNTFYFQAASGTSGGSSGSPVIDREGRAIALNAGGRIDASSSYFLPLDRAIRVLEKLRNGENVTRGTLQTTFVRQSFDELRRLGLDEAMESAVRMNFPDQTGMLVVDQVVPEGPAHERLRPGDILLRIDGRLVTRFVPLAEILDERVGETLALDIRRGEEEIRVELTVGDLKAITPTRYAEVGGAVVNPLSYQQARHFNRAPGGVYVASPGFMFGRAGVPRGSIIRSVGGQRVDTLDDFRAAFEAQPDGARVPVRYTRLDEPRREVLATMNVDRTWFPARLCSLDSATGQWPCEDFAEPPENRAFQAGTVRFGDYGDARAQRLSRSLVWVEFDMPFRVEGMDGVGFTGTGVVVDAREGLVLVDRAAVPSRMGDLRLTFASSLEVPGEVVFLHPLNNLALIQYDPALLVGSDVRSATFNPRRPQPGDELWVVGHRPDQSLVARRTEAGSIEPLRLSLSSSFRFRDVNIDTLSVANPPSDVGGVLADRHGRVLALWANYGKQGARGEAFKGIPADVIQHSLAHGRNGEGLRSLEVEFLLMPMSSARKLGLPDNWASRLAELEERPRGVLSVERIVAGAPAEDRLESGDLLLAVDGRAVNDFHALNQASQAEIVPLTVLRDGEVLELEVPTVHLDGRGIERIVQWAGATLHEPHRAMAAQRGIPRRGVFVSNFSYGSPASRHGLNPGRRIIEVDGKTVTDLDEFLAAVADREHRSPVRLRLEDWDGSTSVTTLKLDKYFWPTSEINRDDGRWRRIQH